MATWDFGGGCPCGVCKVCDCGQYDKDNQYVDDTKVSVSSFSDFITVVYAYYNYNPLKYKETLGSFLLRFYDIEDKSILNLENDKIAMIKFAEKYVK